MSTFFREAFRNIKQTGSVAPSSRFLAAKMTQDIDFSQRLKIVELGAGQGVITRHILHEMSSFSSLMSFEINPYLFREIAKIEDKRFNPMMESALRLSSFNAQNSVDFIISSLPLANMDKHTKKEILKSCYAILKPGGLYIQFQYALNDYGLIKDHYDEIQLGFELLNFPPAFIYYAKKAP
ncbi:class I SAM-dependent methyltransferase [Flavobacterium sp. FlaQc-48]|uniref:class I SAM-dependent methyltransferase n=1 Tax=Flavobacterium sp. FlaQc-48 TaxID=3374181 RepID=UPI0037579311